MPTRTAVASLALPGLQPCGLAWDGEGWWHADGTAHRVYRLDPWDGAIRQEFAVRGAMGGTAWGGGFVWQAIPPENKILKLDPLTGEVLDEIAPGISIVGLTWAYERHLVASGHYEKALYLLDPETGRIEGRMPAPERPSDVTWDGAALWTGGAPGSSRIFRLEPGTGRILEVFEAWGDVRGLAWDSQRLWWVECGRQRAYPGVGRESRERARTGGGYDDAGSNRQSAARADCRGAVGAAAAAAVESEPCAGPGQPR